MYLIDQPDPPLGFPEAWQTAGAHIQNQVQDHINWIRAEMYKPFVEHLSFRVGNQIFWVFLELEENGVSSLVFSGNAKQTFLEKAKESNLWPCLMPMERWGDHWKTKLPGWGLEHAVTGELVNPLDLITEELVVMSTWEVHDLAVQVVLDHLETEGKQVTSYCSYRELDPSIWYQDESGDHWVVVRESIYPVTDVPIPSNINDIAGICRSQSQSGYFAPVSLANHNDQFLGEESALPLYRGHGVFVKFEGLEAIPDPS